MAFTNGFHTFLHQSFAEFFVAKSYLQKISEQKRDDKDFEQILREERNFLIRRFLNDLKENDDSQKEIENFCRENRFFLLKYLVDEKGAKYKN